VAVIDPTAPTFDDQLEAIGFRMRSTSRRGGRVWELAFNSLLTFMLHDYDDHVVMTWTLQAGRLMAQRGWQGSVGDVDELEWFPRADVRLPLDVVAVRTEITRILLSLRLDLGDPAL
jgi:hypothetical protein